MRNRKTPPGGRVILISLLAITGLSRSASAVTYISAEPIPSGDVVGQANLARIESAGYINLELWSTRLMADCRTVQSVIDALAANQAINTVDPANTRFRVAAGGYQAVTDPSYVFTMKDTGSGAVSAADVTVLDNALGYVLSQSGDAHFSPDNPKAYDSPLDYAVVTLPAPLTGLRAKGFFDYLGTIDPALWSGLYAGFTQIPFDGSPTDNSMLFLKPAATKREFIDGLSAAAAATPGAAYVPLNNNGQPTTAKAGVSFPGNDWIAYPGGDQYLAQLGHPSPQLLNALAALRQFHLRNVAALLDAINKGKVSLYLTNAFRCAE